MGHLKRDDLISILCFNLGFFGVRYMLGCETHATMFFFVVIMSVVWHSVMRSLAKDSRLGS